jgi:TolB-like protein/tetratricopeptide (TPR) repeat protein
MPKSHAFKRLRRVSSLGPEISLESIRAELESILSSKTFRVATGQKDLLRFVVDETLANRADLLKEYWIGVKVFRRGESFDPRMSSIVRLEARKLRASLAKYFETEGAKDRVCVEIPKGGYTPVFSLLHQSPALRPPTRTAALTGPQPANPRLARTRFERRLAGESTREVTPVSVAVLPFLDRNSDQGVRFFADGLSDELTVALGRIPDLQLVAQSSAGCFRGEGIDVREVGRLLRVQVVVEGSVRRYGHKFRISVQANETKSGFVLWANSYDREATSRNVLQVQQKVAAAVTKGLLLRILDHASNTADNAAVVTTARDRRTEVQTLPRGRNLKKVYRPDPLEGSTIYINEAISRRLRSARDYVDLAKSLVLEPFWKAASIRDSAAQIKSTASKALKLDGSLGEAHAAMAVCLIADYDWQRAGDEFRRGIELAPGDSTIRSWYANYLMNIGRTEDAMITHKTAAELDSHSAQAISSYGAAFYYSRRFNEAIAHQRRALARDPNLVRAHVYLGLACMHKGSHVRGMTELERARVLTNDAVHPRAHVAYAHATMGNRQRALEILDAFLREYRPDSFPALAIAEIYIGLGNKDQAFDWLHRAIDQKDWTVFLKSDPLFDALRSDPRFSELLRRVHLS